MQAGNASRRVSDLLNTQHVQDMLQMFLVARYAQLGYLPSQYVAEDTMFIVIDVISQTRLLLDALPDST